MQAYLLAPQCCVQRNWQKHDSTISPRPIATSPFDNVRPMFIPSLEPVWDVLKHPEIAFFSTVQNQRLV